MQPTEKELKDYAKAYCVFYKGRTDALHGRGIHFPSTSLPFVNP